MRTKLIELTTLQREQLEKLVNSGQALAREIKHAQVLLKLAEGWPYERIAEAFELSERSISRLKQRYLTEGLDSALHDKPRSGAPKRIDGATEALVIATACTKAPTGHSRWTLRLLAQHLVELDVVESISHEQVRHILRKTP